MFACELLFTLSQLLRMYRVKKSTTSYLRLIRRLTKSKEQTKIYLH